MTHTPWVYQLYKEPLGGGEYKEVYVFGPDGECEIGEVYVREDYVDPGEARADAETHARLIAAAPETAAERDRLIERNQTAISSLAKTLKKYDNLKAINAELLAALKMVETKLPPGPISATLSAVGTDTPVTLSATEIATLRAAIAKAQPK